MNLGDDTVWVLDYSSLIKMKKIVSISNQWDAFKHLETMVDNGMIAMPLQVIRELEKVTHPDLPGAWAVGMRNRLKHDSKTDYANLPDVKEIAKDVIDVNKTQEDADIFVLAHAIQIQRSEREKLPLQKPPVVCIVTEDTTDRITISIATACSKLKLPWCHVREFLERQNIKMRKDSDYKDNDFVG